MCITREGENSKIIFQESYMSGENNQILTNQKEGTPFYWSKWIDLLTYMMQKSYYSIT